MQADCSAALFGQCSELARVPPLHTSLTCAVREDFSEIVSVFGSLLTAD